MVIFKVVATVVLLSGGANMNSVHMYRIVNALYISENDLKLKNNLKFKIQRYLNVQVCSQFTK